MRRSERERSPVSVFSQEGCFAEVLASSLPLGTLDAHTEGGLLWRDQREAERVRERQSWREPERKKKVVRRERYRGLKKQRESESDREKKGEQDERSSPWFVSGQQLPELVCSRLKRSTSAPEAETGKQDQRVARATCMTHIVLKPHG